MFGREKNKNKRLNTDETTLTQRRIESWKEFDTEKKEKKRKKGKGEGNGE